MPDRARLSFFLSLLIEWSTRNSRAVRLSSSGCSRADWVPRTVQLAQRDRPSPPCTSGAAERAGCSEPRASVLREESRTEMQTEGHPCMRGRGLIRLRASRGRQSMQRPQGLSDLGRLIGDEAALTNLASSGQQHAWRRVPACPSVRVY